LGASVTASVTAIVKPKEVNKYFLSLSAATATALQLRLTAGQASTNTLKKVSASGCFLTSCAMIVNYYSDLQNVGVHTDPQELNDWLNMNKGYSGTHVYGSRVADFAASKGIHFSYLNPDTFDDLTLDKYLCGGNPVMLQVTHKKEGDHFVVATGQMTTAGGAKTYTINDPGFNNPTLEAYNSTFDDLRLFTSATTQPSTLYVIGHSPIELLITDPDGKQTGIDPVTLSLVHQIPGATYATESISDDDDPANDDTTPEVKAFEQSGPKPGTYKIDVIGTDDGPYTLDITADDTGVAVTKTIAGNAIRGQVSTFVLGYTGLPGGPLTVVPSVSGPPGAPLISSVANATGYQTKITPGSVFVVFGSNLGPSSISIASTTNYPSSLAGTSVTLTPSGGGAIITARIYYSLNIQVAGLLPSTIPVGTYEVRVTYNGVTSAPMNVAVVTRSFGIATADSSGSGPAQATNGAVNGGISLVRYTSGSVSFGGLTWVLGPAHGGDILVLWGTGGGADLANDTGGSSGDQKAAGNFLVLVGGQQVIPEYAGTSSGYPGLWQVNFRLPLNITPNCSTPVQVSSAGELSNQATIAVAASRAKLLSESPKLICGDPAKSKQATPPFGRHRTRLNIHAVMLKLSCPWRSWGHT